MLQRKPGVPVGDGYISVVTDHAAPKSAEAADEAQPDTDESTRRIERVAADALEQLRLLSQEHAALGGQVAALERQVRTLLIERLELSAEVAALQRENAQLRAAVAAAPPPRPAALPRHEPPLPLRGALGSAHRPAPAPDDETLLMGETIAEAALPLAHSASPEPLPTSYVLIAQPFSRFSDLGRFQTAVQALRGVQNARVRRFAQGTLEMRLDYDDPRPLREALADLTLAVEAIEQLSPHRLVIRLQPDSLA